MCTGTGVCACECRWMRGVWRVVWGVVCEGVGCSVVWAVGGAVVSRSKAGARDEPATSQRHLATTRADCHQITWFREMGLTAFQLDAGSRLVGG